MTIHIDNRAGSKDLVKHPPLDDPNIATLCHIDSGDVMFLGNGPQSDVMIGVEVKSIWDLISSIANKRLAGTQIPNMLKSYDYSWLLFYGQYRSAPDGQLVIQRGNDWVRFSLGRRAVMYSYLEGFLYDLEVSGVRVHHAYDIKVAARWIYTLYQWWVRPWKSHKAMRVFDNSRAVTLTGSNDSALLRRANLASKLPGLGYERAVAAAKHFLSISDMVNASADEWAEVEGIGKTIAGAVVHAIHEKQRQKGASDGRSADQYASGRGNGKARSVPRSTDAKGQRGVRGAGKGLHGSR